MFEKRLVQSILGTDSASVLMTDGYKFSMALAGFPLRKETFHMAFRHGGPWYIPFDLEKVIRELLPQGPFQEDELKSLDGYGYQMTPAMKAAMAPHFKDLEIHAAPQGSWVLRRESSLTMSGPSFLFSWLEPLGLMLNFPIQVATEALLCKRNKFVCTCDSEAEIVRTTLAAGLNPSDFFITSESSQYRADVARRIQLLINALEDKDPSRIFEVGMRACSCMEMHQIALEECRKAGILRTSNVYLARQLGLTAVGTTGHEHIQRWGDDLTANRAMRDMRPQRPSYLPDTFDAMGLGLAAAFVALEEQPDDQGTIRLDSGDQWPQISACEAKATQPGFTNPPNYIFEDGIDDEKIARDEEWCQELHITADRRAYGSGGFIVKSEFSNLTRDNVAAVWKLSQTGTVPVMKTCTTAPSKASVPGVPVIFRRNPAEPCSSDFHDCAGLIGQAGETPPNGFFLLDFRLGEPLHPVVKFVPFFLSKVGFSPRTQELIDQCVAKLNVWPSWAWKKQ